MNIRQMQESDGQAIYELHIASIKQFCSPFYTPDAIQAWIDLKSPNDYKTNQDNIILVAQSDDEVVGFAHVRLSQKAIKGLYIKPGFEGKGFGKALLREIEKMARESGVEKLELNATLNAVGFYEAMGYRKIEDAVHKLKGGVELKCVRMGGD